MRNLVFTIILAIMGLSLAAEKSNDTVIIHRDGYIKMEVNRIAVDSLMAIPRVTFSDQEAKNLMRGMAVKKYHDLSQAITDVLSFPFKRCWSLDSIIYKRNKEEAEPIFKKSFYYGEENEWLATIIFLIAYALTFFGVVVGDKRRKNHWLDVIIYYLLISIMIWSGYLFPPWVIFFGGMVIWIIGILILGPDNYRGAKTWPPFYGTALPFIWLCSWVNYGQQANLKIVFIQVSIVLAAAIIIKLIIKPIAKLIRRIRERKKFKIS